MKRIRLAIISTHPIQYYAPVFRALAADARVEPRVFYTWSQAAAGAVVDPGFGNRFSWDIPLLEGYELEFVPNTARDPSTSHFWGIRNPMLVRTIEAWGADAVLVYGWNLASHLAALRHFKGRVPVFFRGDSTLLDAQPAFRSFVRERLLSWVYSHIDVAISVGSNSRDYFAWCGVPAERIAFAPHSVDTARFQDADGMHGARAAQWRRQLGIEPDALVLVFAAKFIEKKDPLSLLQAFRGIDTDAHLVYVGNGALEGEMKAHARGCANVHFLPFQNQSAMPAVYRLGEVFLLPSCGPGETWGLALNEAMASGRAVVAGSKVGGARDLIRHGVNGWTFQSGSTEDLARVLREALATDRHTLGVMGRLGEKAISAWSTQEAARGIAEAVVRFSAGARTRA
jgi:glycosyltransferase involved in cell wall biosynthesis